jgi:transposase
MAAYMVHEGTVMNYCDDWQRNHYVQGVGSPLTSQTTSRIFEGITHDEQTAFFKEWAKISVGDENIFYDVTSVSSYSSGNELVEWGYNRDGENLGQVNIGMFCGEKTRLPIYYNVYNGSLTDKGNIGCVLQNARDIGIEKVKLVLDGGFCDGPRLKELRSSGHVFTVGTPISLNEAKIYVHGYGKGINKASNKLRRHPEYCVSVPTEFMGVDGRIIICFNEAMHSDMTASLIEKVDKLEEKLKGMKRTPKKGMKAYEKYFKVSKTENGFHCERKHDVIDAEAEMAGYFLLFSTDMESEVEDLLYFYRAKDIDEKMFCQLKVHIDGSRLRIHNSRTMSGKMFVIFIALIIRSCMFNNLSGYLAEEHITLKKAILRLSDIKIIKGRENFRFIKALTKKQRTLLNVFSATEAMGKSLDQLE